MEGNNMAIIKDPNLVNNRIFIGNLPVCTKEDLEGICAPYGNVLGSMVQKNFGFIQYESEEIATKAATSLNRSTFKGNTVTVRNAGSKVNLSKKAQAQKNANAGNNDAAASNLNSNQSQGDNNPYYNDCEIIVVDRKNTQYAEFIEDRLKRLGLHVDVLFPNEEVSLGKVLSNISSRGCLYAILVTNQNEEHRSITVNILYGQPAEHRNMPVEDAINLLFEDYRTKKSRDAAALAANNSLNHLPRVVPVITPNNVTNLKERHPDSIQMLLNLLAENLPLTVIQYDRIIKYLEERRDLQLKVELGDAADEAIRAPDPEIELQKKILNILNKPSVAETHYDLLYPDLDTIKKDFRAMELLKDIRVQMALSSLMDSNLTTVVAKHMKF